MKDSTSLRSVAAFDDSMPEAASISCAACSVADKAPDTVSTRPLTSWLVTVCVASAFPSAGTMAKRLPASREGQLSNSEACSALAPLRFCFAGSAASLSAPSALALIEPSANSMASACPGATVAALRSGRPASSRTSA